MGGFAIINDGTWVGPGSAARNTSRTSRRDLFKSGRFRPDNFATPLLLRFGLVYIFSGSERVRKQNFIVWAFFRPATKRHCRPLC